MASILGELFRHNRWANLQTIEACTRLTDAQFDATVEGTAGTIRYTLMHITGAEQRYVMRLSKRQPTYGERDGWPGLDTLRQALEESGRALLELLETVPQDRVLTLEYEGTRQQLPVTTVFVQAINHATEHRNQIATIMTQQGVTPVDVSGWAYDSVTREG